MPASVRHRVPDLVWRQMTNRRGHGVPDLRLQIGDCSAFLRLPAQPLDSTHARQCATTVHRSRSR